MTIHEGNRPADYDSVEESEATGRSDDPTDEQYDPGTDTDAHVVADDMNERVEHEPETASSREHGAVAADTDEAEGAETESVDTDEADDPTAAELADESDEDPVAVDRTPESDPLQKIAPVGPDTAMDPGTGTYQDRWAAIQGGFIDDPRRTVESASNLVVEIWDETVRAITDEREGLDGRWQSTGSSTDDLRAAMQDYRDLYARLVRFSSDR